MTEIDAPVDKRCAIPVMHFKNNEWVPQNVPEMMFSRGSFKMYDKVEEAQTRSDMTSGRGVVGGMHAVF
eukprot:1134675-Pelagomonas_calceolata.AAC.4